LYNGNKKMKKQLAPDFVKKYNRSVWAVLQKYIPQRKKRAQIFADIRFLYKKESSALSGQNLRNPRTFDIFSYCTFKAIAGNIQDEYLRLRFTQEVGRKIYEQIKAAEKFEISGNPDDLANIKNILEKIGKYFQQGGYISNFHFRWQKIFNENRWEKEGIGNFAYTMENPVILPGAQRLFTEEGLAQHLSSRTLESALLDFGIEGRELEDFDPTQFNADAVEEIWEIRKIKNNEHYCS